MNRVDPLISTEGRPLVLAEVENTTIIVHAVLDGLWIEAGLSQTPVNVENLIGLSIRSIEKLLDIRL